MIAQPTLNSWVPIIKQEAAWTPEEIFFGGARFQTGAGPLAAQFQDGALDSFEVGALIRVKYAANSFVPIQQVEYNSQSAWGDPTWKIVLDMDGFEPGIYPLTVYIAAGVPWMVDTSGAICTGGTFIGTVEIIP